jgi:hypothetical protein
MPPGWRIFTAPATRGSIVLPAPHQRAKRSESARKRNTVERGARIKVSRSRATWRGFKLFSCVAPAGG